MVSKKDSNKARLQRHKRVRAKISGTAERPRLDVFRSAKNIYAQVIDDVAGVTLVSASTAEKSFTEYGGNKEAAKEGGKAAVEAAKPRRLVRSLPSAARLRALRLSCLTAAAMCSTAA